MKYDHKKIEREVQKFWEENKIFECDLNLDRKKYYILDMFPYPSGEGLHVGHAKGYSASDTIAHYMRLKDYNVLHPMGWDAFGLPAENYAIKVKKNPKDVVAVNVEKFKSQCKMMGFSYDWTREINTTDPKYYKWTQWIFLKLFEKGLAYQDDIEINFCPSCKTGLANEEVQGGECERCHTRVQRKKLKQWVLKITEYADRLLDDIDELDWPEAIKEMQRNWIGKSTGSVVKFKVESSKKYIEVYTTRIDTIFSGTFLLLAPEHPLAQELTIKENEKEVNDYIELSLNKIEIERIEGKNKTGVFTGSYAINPASGDKIPIWISDFVIFTYGTGAVFADAHDKRDFEMAKKHGLPLKVSIKPTDDNLWKKVESLDECFEDDGILTNSGQFSKMGSEEARGEITKWLEEQGLARFETKYKLRDWVFSRQRYWGEPIPIIHCKECGPVAVPEESLPVVLPTMDNYEPTGTGESPLAKLKDWVDTICPKCGKHGERETNTMPNWAGSSWYYIAYALGKKLKVKSEKFENIFSKYTEELDHCLPVDFYIGGAEHAVLHLLYARFWHKFLYDEKIIKDNEPFKKLKNVGLILGPDNQKMSKSRGNVINPDELVDKYGADALRMYELFIGPFDQSAVWNTKGIKGTRKFLEKIYNNFKPQKNNSSADLQGLANNITDKIEKNLFNTAISDLMKFSNDNEISKLGKSEWNEFLTLLTPFAPHMSESLSLQLNEKSIFNSSWPDVKVVSKIPTYSVQINGKFRALLNLEGEEEVVVGEAKKLDNVKKHLAGKTIKKTILVKGKIVNFVV